MEQDVDALLVLSNLPDAATAEALARVLIEQRMAACVNVLAGCRSIYRWQGLIEQADEVPVLIKTTRARYPECESVIRAYHPYALPEIIALPITAGLPDYLAWVAAECTSPDTTSC